jgi:regulator of protease activity HflC (stomatin/prohibitin superfamily)
MNPGLIALIAIALLVLIGLARSIRIVPQARAGIVERLGRFQRVLGPGLNILIPFIDRMLPLIDLREQVVTFPPQAVITSDNVSVSIDTVIYYRVIDPQSVTYEIAMPIQAIEQLSVTTLRNVIGGLDLEKALTSRDEINSQLRTVLDEATGNWGIRIERVEIKAIDPPPTVQQAMEKQLQAERSKRAEILNAEGEKQSQILRAEGSKASQILTAQGERESEILRAEGQAKAVETVFHSLHEGQIDDQVLGYLYLEMLPKLADGQANKIFVIPSEITEAFGKASKALDGSSSAPPKPPKFS